MCQQYINRYSGSVQHCFSHHSEVSKTYNAMVYACMHFVCVYIVLSPNMEGDVETEFTE